MRLRHNRLILWFLCSLILIGLVTSAHGFQKVEKKPRLIVMPLQPQEGQRYDGTGLGLQFLLGNVVALHTGLREFWFGWRLKRLFPEKGTLGAFCRGKGGRIAVRKLGKEQGIRYWLLGNFRQQGGLVRVGLRLTDIQNKGPAQTTEIALDPADKLVGFREALFDWLETCGLPVPQGQKAKALWHEETTLHGLDLLGRALETFYLYATGESTGPLDLHYFDQAVAAAPVSYLALDLKGWALLKEGYYQKAAQAFRSALKHNPNGLGALSGLMWCAIRTQKEKEAYRWARAKALTRNESPVLAEASAANRMGNVAFSSKDYEEAITFYQKAANWNSAKILYAKKLVKTYQEMQQFGLSLETLERALKNFKENKDQKTLLIMKAVLSYEYATSLRKQRKYHEAIRHYKDALAIDRIYRPGQVEADLENIASVYDELADHTHKQKSH